MQPRHSQWVRKYSVTRSNHCALGQILKLTDIATPRVRPKGQHSFFWNLVDLLAHATAEFADEVHHERWDGFLPRPQGRQHNWKNIEAELTIAPEFASRRHYFMD